ncbi:hypothetical protein TPHA_0K01480 [Tetrapisispora phaffii CBS 4417]|uniref:SWR1-complex protein 4 n=1 Tax=Tetrapisispora phaffii (strain ATCC 24235 / CBS 4417 / NBRC 1672 / NRRL Y-8282 / UCD 70-5) TaxID=1071381 RepID=G8BZF3_TETPH|nr:hypothetical protein TPHA_0K01480 [Tetrapisispora phaffii CBS 4417]CCE65281.1 hypothetical protein TPHA_0K01480 [Tetrapisispora phaffii CBS 4417]
MSSSDIFDVLNIQQKSKSPNVPTSSNVAKPNPINKSQVTTMQRELFNLLGDNQPSIMVGSKNNRFKEKLNKNVKVSPWTLAPFQATSTLKLNHWVKGSKELVGKEPQESAFAKYNQHLTIPTFTEKEYLNFMTIKENHDQSMINNNQKADTNVQEEKTLNSNNEDSSNKNSGNKENVNESLPTENKEDVVEKFMDANESVSEVLDGSKKPTNTNKNENGVENYKMADNNGVNPEAINDEDIKQNDEENLESHVSVNLPDKQLNSENENSIESLNNNKKEKTQKEWSFKEVEYLFNLCRKFDLNWHVIYDRYNFENENNDNEDRRLDDLKAKFYEISKKYFLTIRPDDPLVAQLTYSKEKELERKRYLDRLLARSAAEIAEEEALIIESRKFEMAAKKTLNERENLLRLLDSPNSNQSISQYMTSQGISQLYSSLLTDKSRKRKHMTSVPENPWMKQQNQFAQQRQRFQQMHGIKQEGSNISTNKPNRQNTTNYDISTSTNDDTNMEAGSHGLEAELNADSNMLSQSQKSVTKKQKLELQIANKRKAESEYADSILQNFNKEEQESLGLKAHGEKLKPGVYTRSSKISTYKPAVQNKINIIIQELGLPLRPVMLTSKVFDKYEELSKQIVTLNDLKRHLDKLEAENFIIKK